MVAFDIDLRKAEKVVQILKRKIYSGENIIFSNFRRHLFSKKFIRFPKNVKSHFRLDLFLLSKQQRGDVVSNGEHCGIAVSATESIAAGQTKVYSRYSHFTRILFLLNRIFFYYLFRCTKRQRLQISHRQRSKDMSARCTLCSELFSSSSSS
jgi:hypothetical protein